MKSLLSLAFVAALSGIAAADPPACSAAPRSCGSWSDWYAVSSSCGWSKVCDGEFFPTIQRVTVEQQHQFRSCVYLDGTQCVETKVQYVNSCGCY